MLLQLRTIFFLAWAIPVIINTQEPTICLPQSWSLEQTKQQIAHKLITKELEFAFDIHKVIAKASVKKQISTVVNDPAKYQLFSFLTNFSLLKHATSSLAQMICASLNPQIGELCIERFIEPLQQQNRTELVGLLIKMANALEINQDVATIIEQLATKKIPVRVASNINHLVFEHLKKQLNDDKKNIFSLFTKNENNLEGKVVMLNGVSKPDPRFFEEYNAEYNATRTKLFIFIDDKKENIDSALQQGSFVGIVFKNANQLKSDLYTLGITIN